MTIAVVAPGCGCISADTCRFQLFSKMCAWWLGAHLMVRIWGGGLAAARARSRQARKIWHQHSLLARFWLGHANTPATTMRADIANKNTSRQSDISQRLSPTSADLESRLRPPWWLKSWGRDLVAESKSYRPLPSVLCQNIESFGRRVVQHEVGCDGTPKHDIDLCCGGRCPAPARWWRR